MSIEPIYDLPIPFWDIGSMRKEALSLKNNAKKWINENFTVQGHPLTADTPALRSCYEKFIEKYGDFGEISVSYLYIDKDSDYAWHVDNEISKWTGNTDKDIKCAINIVILGEENEVEFENFGMYRYTTALFNTSHLHRIKPKTDRIITKFSFREMYYVDVLNRIKAGTLNG